MGVKEERVGLGVSAVVRGGLFAFDGDAEVVDVDDEERCARCVEDGMRCCNVYREAQRIHSANIIPPLC